MAHRIDRYEIVRKLATGGMADVFLALQWGDGGFVREVVVKRMHAHMAAEASLLEDFRNEADLLARLGGPGIPHVHEFRCSSNSEWYFAMEHVRGPTISQLVQQTSKGERLPLPIALSIGSALCRILDDVHDSTDPLSGSELGVVHGDLTPSNVVTDAQGRVHLLDFGIAGSDKHRMSRLGGAHGIRGTVGYFAPEAAQSEKLPDRRADVFSIGALLFELVTGQEAFTRIAIEYINVIRNGPSVRPCEVDGSLPPAIDDLLMRCLSPNPSERPARAGEVADAIDALALEEGLHIGRLPLADYVDTYFPEQEDAPTRVGAAPDERGFVVPLPDLDEGQHEESLSADERDELLADLALFAPDGAAFLEEPALERPAPAQPPSLPPDARVKRAEKATPVAFPAVTDIAASSMPPDAYRPQAYPSQAADTTPPSGPTRRSESRRKRVVHPDSDTPLEAKTPAKAADDSGGFYIYVADDD